MMHLQTRPATHARKKFHGYTPEERKIMRTADIREDVVQKQLIELWRNFNERAGRLDPSYIEIYDIANLARNLVKEEYSSEDLEKFVVVLTQFQDERKFPIKAGALLSALINAGKDQDYVIKVDHFDEPISALGFKNRKNLRIIGNLYRSIGVEMKGGSITVEGDVRYTVGSKMEGGTIIVNGNVGWEVGQQMKDGKIIIKGDVDEEVGLGMEGGKLVIEGNVRYDAGQYMKGGKLYIKKSAGHKLGLGMQGGQIIVDGDAEHKIGGDDYSVEPGMSGGEIHVNGNIGRISNRIIGGRIYHKGKLIVDK